MRERERERERELFYLNGLNRFAGFITQMRKMLFSVQCVDHTIYLDTSNYRMKKMGLS